ANVCPAEGRFEEAEGVLNGEAPQIPAPQHAEIRRQRASDPGQPQGPRWQLLVGQALDLDTDDAERSMWCAAHVEFGPHVDGDDAIRRMVKLNRSLRLAMSGFVGQSKRF